MTIHAPIAYPRTTRLVSISQVVPWPHNPQSRMRRDAKFLRLLGSISRRGMLVPIDVVEEPPIFRLISGHQRVAAATELGWQLIEAWVYFMPFDDALALLQPIEYQRRVWGGHDNGQMVISLGAVKAAELLEEAGYPDDAAAVLWASEQMDARQGTLLQMLSRFGVRPLRRARPLANETWPLERICAAILRHGTYRDLERKGLTVEDRCGLLQTWEEAAAGVAQKAIARRQPR